MRQEVVVLLDRSGSMEDRKHDHEGGLNSFIRSSQEDLQGDVRFTFIQFDTAAPCEVVQDGVPLKEAQPITLIPRGGTPLLDAVGMAMAHVEARLNKEGITPDIGIFMIVTDGEENQSREWTKARVKERIGEWEKGSWRFLFLATNIDAFGEARQLGMSAATTMSYTNNSMGVAASYGSFTRNAVRTLRASASGQSVGEAFDHLSYTEEQREAAAGTSTAASPSVTTTSNTKETK